METLLNAPYWLIGLLALLGAGLLVSSLRGADRRVRAAAVGCFAGAVLLVGLRYLVPTDEKKVESETRRLATAVDKRDWATVASLVKDASLLHLHGQEIVDRAQGIIQQFSLTSLKINSTTTSRTQGVITVTLSITTRHENTYYDTVPSTWNMEWQKRAGTWALLDIHPVRIGTGGAAEAESIVR